MYRAPSVELIVVFMKEKFVVLYLHIFLCVLLQQQTSSVCTEHQQCIVLYSNIYRRVYVFPFQDDVFLPYVIRGWNFTSTYSAWVWRMSRVTRDRTAERVSRDQTFRRERGQTVKYLNSLAQLTTSRIGNLTCGRSILRYLLSICDGHAYSLRDIRINGTCITVIIPCVGVNDSITVSSA